MQRNSSELTVYYDGQYWVGICQRQDEAGLRVCRVVFGAEPKDYEVYEYILLNWHALEFSKSVETGQEHSRRINPKRMQRQINKQLGNQGAGTKAQQAISQQREQKSLERKTTSRLRRDEEKERRFILRQEKKKLKHRGR